MQIQRYLELSPESKYLNKEAEKMGIRRQFTHKAFDTFIESDRSLIYRMYYVYCNIMPHKLWFWSPSGKEMEATITISPGVQL